MEIIKVFDHWRCNNIKHFFKNVAYPKKSARISKISLDSSPEYGKINDGSARGDDPATKIDTEFGAKRAMNAPQVREDAAVSPEVEISNPPSNARVEANRRNARKSTGPKTVEGKEKSRGNSLKHGLTGAGIVLLEADEARLRKEVEEWSETLQPRDEPERAMVEALIVAKDRMERAAASERALRQRRSERASRCWKEDQALEVQRLADKLARAKTPGLIVQELRQTPVGCDWLIDRWKELDWALDLKGNWDDSCRTLAFDLLGAPRATRDYAVELPGDATIDEQRGLVRRRIEELTRYRDALMDIDELERAGAIEGLSWDDSPEARRLRSYDQRNRREFQKLMDHFRKRLKDSSKSVPVAPKPKRTSEPPPRKNLVEKELREEFSEIPAAVGRNSDERSASVSASAPVENTPEFVNWVRQAMEGRRESA